MILIGEASQGVTGCIWKFVMSNNFQPRGVEDWAEIYGEMATTCSLERTSQPMSHAQYLREGRDKWGWELRNVEGNSDWKFCKHLFALLCFCLPNRPCITSIKRSPERSDDWLRRAKCQSKRVRRCFVLLNFKPQRHATENSIKDACLPLARIPQSDVSTAVQELLWHGYFMGHWHTAGSLDSRGRSRQCHHKPCSFWPSWEIRQHYSGK